MNSKRLSINFVSNIIQFLTSLTISFFFTPYIVSTVGEEGYGFYSIACTCISYFTVLATAMNSMASRFITIEYHNGSKEKVKSYYATTFYSNLFIAFLFSIIIVLCVSQIDKILNVPSEMVSDVKGMFYFVLFAGLLSSVTAVFSSTVFCLDRLDIKSIAMIFISIIRVGLLYVFLTFTDVKLIYLGISYSVSIVFEALVYVVTTIKMMPSVRLSPKDYKISAAKTLVGSGIWNSVNQVNTILSSGLDLLMANLFISPAMAGILSVSKTIPNQLMTLLLMLVNIFLPTLTIAYAKKDKAELKNIFQTSFDIMGIFMGIVMAGFVVVGKEFFELWMPDSNPNLIYILSLLGMTSFWVIGSTQTMGQATLLANKMRVPVLIVLVRNLVGIVIVLTFSNIYSGYAVYIIAAISPILSIFFELLFNVPYASKCVDFPKRFFYRNKMIFIIDIVILILIFSVIKFFVMQSVSWLRLCVCVAICSIIGVLFNMFFFLNRTKRRKLITKFKNKTFSNEKR